MHTELRNFRLSATESFACVTSVADPKYLISTLVVISALPAEETITFTYKVQMLIFCYREDKLSFIATFNCLS
jgi:hypothetical protein